MQENYSYTPEEQRLLQELGRIFQSDDAPAEREAAVKATLAKLQMELDRKFEALREIVEAAGGEVRIEVSLQDREPVAFDWNEWIAILSEPQASESRP